MSEVDDTISQEAAETADAQEWDSAFEKYDSEKGIKSEKTEDVKKVEKTGDDDKKEYTNDELLELKKAEDEAAEKKKAEEAEARKNETAEEKAEREKKEAEEAADKEESAEEAKARREAAARAREVREASRDFVADTEAVKADVMEQMFKDKDGKLYDADGDEIRLIEDVMALRNPRTGKNFTEDEAAAYLLKATQHAKQEQIEAQQRAAEIAEEIITLKDQAETVKDKYGEFLNDPKNADLKAEIWADYEATFVLDEESGIITKAPVSMVRFYDRALKPYVEAQTTITSAEQAKTEAEAAAEKAKAEAAKARTRNDREDIFARGDAGRDTLSKEEKEWADAEKAYYGRK